VNSDLKPLCSVDNWLTLLIKYYWHVTRWKGKRKGNWKKMWQGTMRSEGKHPRTTSVIDPPLHDSLRRELNHSWWSDRVVMALAAAGGGDRTQSDASLPFHSNCADRETSQQKHYAGATSSHAICPCSPRTHTVLTTLQRTRSTSRSRFFGRPPFTTGNKTNLASNIVVYNTQWCNVSTHRLLQGVFRYNFHT